MTEATFTTPRGARIVLTLDGTRIAVSVNGEQKADDCQTGSEYSIGQYVEFFVQAAPNKVSAIKAPIPSDKTGAVRDLFEARTAAFKFEAPTVSEKVSDMMYTKGGKLYG